MAASGTPWKLPDHALPPGDQGRCILAGRLSMFVRPLSFVLSALLLLSAAPAAAQFERPCPKKGHIRHKGKCVSKAALEAERRRAAARRRASMGSITIKSLPLKAEVWLDGKKQRGVTPLELKNIKIGDYVLELRKGYQVYRGKITVESQKSITRFFELDSPVGVLVVQSNPSGAKIFLDGKALGKTPRELPQIKAGEHVLELQRSGFAPTREDVILGVDESRKVVSVTLQRKGVVKVSSVPAGAEVFIDGQKAGRTPGRLMLLPGPHALQLRLNKHVQIDRKIEVELGKVIDLQVKMDLTPEEKQHRAALARHEKKMAEMRRAEAEKRDKLAREKYDRAQADFERKTVEVKPLRRSKSIWAYTTLGVGLALAGAGGALFAVGYTQGEAAKKDYDSVDSFDQEALDGYRDKAKTAELEVIVGAALMGTGAAILGVSIYMFASKPGLPEKPILNDFLTSVSFAPTRGGAALSWGSMF